MCCDRVANVDTEDQETQVKTQAVFSYLSLFV